MAKKEKTGESEPIGAEHCLGHLGQPPAQNMTVLSAAPQWGAAFCFHFPSSDSWRASAQVRSLPPRSIP